MFPASLIRAARLLDDMKQGFMNLPSFSGVHGAFEIVTGYDELPAWPPAKELASCLPENTSGHGALLALLGQDAAAACQAQSRRACL